MLQGKFEQVVGTNSRQKAQITSLKKNKAELIDENTTLRNEVVELKRELAEKERSEKSLMAQVQGLIEEMDRFKEEHKILMISQAAACFEQAICSDVLPDVYERSKMASLHELLNYLNDSDKKLPLDPRYYNFKAILKDARRRWEELCDILEFPKEWVKKTGRDWDVDRDHDIPYIIKAIDFLKHVRRNIAHPIPVKVEEAERTILSMSNSYPRWQFEPIKKFITSLKDNMDKSGLHHPHLKFPKKKSI